MVTRTVTFPLNLEEAEEKNLFETVDLYTKAWNYFVDIAWQNQGLTKRELHDKAYYEVRNKFGLKSQYTCSSRDRAFEAVLSAKHRKVTSKPASKLIPIRLDKNTFTFKDERSAITVTVQQGRITIPLHWHRHAQRYKDWVCIAGEIGFTKWNTPVLRLFFTKEPDVYPRTGVIIGADRGINRPIVLSLNTFYGKAIWKEHERRLFSLIARLQSKGTKSAIKHLVKVWRRLRLFRENCDRVVAKEIIARLQPGDTIVIEDLTNIRDRCGAKRKVHKKHRRKVGRWSFKRLEQMLRYYAELKGIYIEKVKPNYTSQECSGCGVVCKKNRRGSLYSCSCGLRVHADLNAARNIANRWCEANGGASGPYVNRPIVEAST